MAALGAWLAKMRLPAKCVILHDMHTIRDCIDVKRELFCLECCFAQYNCQVLLCMLESLQSIANKSKVSAMCWKCLVIACAQLLHMD